MIREILGELFHKESFLLFFTVLSYILGIVGFFCDCSVQTLTILTAILLLFLVKNYVGWRSALFWVAIFFVGYFNAELRIKNSDELCVIAPQNVSVSGQIVSIPDDGLKSRTRFFFQVDKVKFADKVENVKAKTFVNVNGNGDFNIGDYYEIKGKLRVPSNVSNPSQFDYGKYLRNFNTFTTLFAQLDDCKQVNIQLKGSKKFLRELNNLRQEIISEHAENIKSPNIEILGGIVFGDDAVSPPDYIKKAFINSGILHILAASGMNVALIYGIWFFILSKLKMPYRVNVVGGIFVVLLYTLMTGMGASVIRAAIILEFILIGKLFDRDADSIALLSFVALLMLLFNPAYINDVGFQLSFIVTFGLLVMSPPLFKKVNAPNWFSSSVFIPIIAQLWVAPIQMFYFNSFSLYSVIVNILILPFVTVISFGGFISSVLAMIKPIANVVCLVFDFVLNPFLSGLVWISDYFSKLPASLIVMPKPSLLQVLLYYIFLMLIVAGLKKGFNRKISFSCLFMVLIIFLSGVNFSKSSELIVFDVKNADCMLYKTPKNKYFVIDTGKMAYGSGKSQLSYILGEYLKDKGIRNIEGLILTHFDSDHAGGAEDLIQDFNVEHIYVNSLKDKSRIARKIYKYSPELVRSGQEIYSESNLKITTYLAGLDEEKENENSIMTLISEGDYNILLTGDAGVEAYQKVERYLPERIDVLKVGHHGARGVVNKEMIQRLNPEYSIISTGTNNYGHPNKVILNILSPTKILRTDRNNAIKITKGKAFVYDSKKGWIE